MTEPLVTIVMPAHDVAAYVDEAVTSALRQSWPRLELICVDDGSRDGTAGRLEALAAQWRGPGREMTVLRQANAGAAAARNAGLARARGEYLCLLDADDRLAPDLVARTVGTLAADPALLLAAPLWRYVDEAGRPIGIVSDPGGLRHDAHGLVVRGPLHSATGVTVRAAAARRTGPFDTSLSGCIDLDWFVRLIAGHGAAAAVVPRPLADYRKRGGQITADWRRMEANWTRLLEKMEAAGHGLSARDLRRARARNLIYWASLAYQAGDYPAARRLTAESWALAPGAAARDPLARIRTLAALASLLPPPLHDRLRDRAGRRAHSARSSM
jgi:glycosyltransferase involved in cell wall biosynthesis